MKKALVTTIQRTINSWHYGSQIGEEGYWEDVVYPINSIINLIIIGDDYIPPPDTVLVDIPAGANIGDIVEI